MTHRSNLDRISDISDPWERADEAHYLTQQLTELAGEASRTRRDAIVELDQAGVESSAIATHIGLTRSRISAILKQGQCAERALFSQGGESVTIALGSRHSDGAGAPSDMITRDAAAAGDVLAAALRDYGIDHEREVVPAPGLVNLNRTSLVVMGSPKILPLMEQVCAADPHIMFAADGIGRHLLHRDTGEIYRSPQDRAEHADYAYAGRLPRPDGQGSLLYLAGLHAAGTHGAARHLVDNAESIHRTVRRSRFSVLVRVDYEGRDRRITRTAPVTPIYTW